MPINSMTFAQYIEIVKDSVATQGYDGFFPSLCVDGPEIRLEVLECDLGDAGEESLAKDWVAAYLGCDRAVYLAYRVGARNVDVCEICGSEVVQKVRIYVSDGSG